MPAAEKIIHRYFHQLISGCGNPQCSNIYCRSSSSFKYDKTILEDRNQVAAEVIRLSSEYAPLCDDINLIKENEQKIEINNLTENNLKELISQCEKTNDWNILEKSMEIIFSNRFNLLTSFLKVDFSENISNKSESSPTASATPKSFFIHDPRITLDNDEITLDFDTMKSTMKLLRFYEDQISSTIHKSLDLLLNQLQYELKSKRNELETDANFFNLFLIIFELPYLSDPLFLFDIARLFYSILTNLSIEAQAKFVRILSKYATNLDAYVLHVQQYITMHTIRWCDHVGIETNSEELLSSEPGIKEGLNTLRLLSYANLLSGQRDSSEIIDIERKNYEKTERELVKRRQRQNDTDSDTEEQQRNEQQQSDSENILEASTSSATTATTRTKIRKATSEIEDTDSPYDNALQIKLDLKPNEYRRGQYSFDIFINEYANEKLEIKKEYLNFIQQPISSIEFSFIYYPFFLSTINKIALLNIESKARMYLQRRSIFVHNIFSSIRLNPVFKINVRRDHLIEDALISLEYQGIEQPEELKKQLFVEFEGEQGHDEGGLSKEFFQLITEQIFSPEYAMFMTNEETRCLWFNPSAAEDLDREYTLIGMLFGLAIYNSIILDIRFPPILYRKLLGKFGTFEDLETSHPTSYKSLKSLLAFNEKDEGMTVEDAFSLTFQVAITDAIGSQLLFDLKDDGDTISVTNANREEFVHLYSDLLLNKSIQKQFDPFFHGFLLVTHDSSLRKLFRADEIDLLVAGSHVFDFNQLASAAEYDGDYSKDSPTIKNFWTVLMTFTDEQKRKFLRFTTGSDRIPIGGLARLKLIISRNGPDTDRLPTAHTCFNALLLPDYSSIEKLQEKLSIAIDNAEGFGLR
ncbi:unnamed protein product [Rotaria magnacalcarata]|uniref:HECT-type E3 ubiquitin transferase n=1 Tax=Rotaria magnacalcarata TaxID=392030 RepID=A0A816NG80_9BILA|nr:unnamed protein product [Rotaria magnacalcarata]CAF2051217.1 unnamed protein product [Rotaria magnacalcarata]CAF3737053.1 unnamed protein product [Rotaria magnacalcarata]CAF3784669.1 unnamed protein product [Rotaria magnacalcarata]